MADETFGGYTPLVNATSAGAKTEINANIDKLKALIPDGTATSAVEPEFDRIHPALAFRLREEIEALKAAITAGA